ncbi:membrane protein FAM174B [Boleophthalmus pectinirostris]|uniref:membrane protein FAM174B n=1 Tax=Boleophthalmus pectinirostris TaxID=150288 RepID=UPI000A1C4F28|nr:membrane protein FAM174B [Boleophthalmus pectinirostris]
MLTHNLALIVIAAFTWCVSAELSHVSSSTAAAHLNSTASSHGLVSGEGHGLQPGHNATDSAVGSRISTLMTYLPSLKKGVFFVCVMTAGLVVCLLVKVVRSGRRIRKTRKYDIITTPGERVEMAPLNQDAEEDDDSTLFDVKYR